MPFQNVSAPDRLRLSLQMPLAVALQVYRLFLYAYDTFRFTGSPAAMLVYLGVAKKLDLKLKNGRPFRLTKSNFHQLIGMAADSAVGLDSRFKVCNKDDYRIISSDRWRVATIGGIRPVMVEFEKGVHTHVDVKNKDVVDIGSYMGETALYFAIKGHARKVYTFESVKSLYKAAVKNIRLNKLDGKIKAYNVAIVERSVNSRNSFSLDGNKAPTATLGSLCRILKINDGVLKIDVEGAEYGIINCASSSTLRRFSFIHIEYHYGYSDLVERLMKEGFDVNYTKPVPVIVGLFSGVKYMGDIIAKRRN